MQVQQIIASLRYLARAKRYEELGFILQEAANALERLSKKTREKK